MAKFIVRHVKTKRVIFVGFSAGYARTQLEEAQAAGKDCELIKVVRKPYQKKRKKLTPQFGKLDREARFWRRASKTADRIGHDRPVNRQAAKDLKR